jgi:membrane protease YdiL (CAAX protease family)
MDFSAAPPPQQDVSAEEVSPLNQPRPVSPKLIFYNSAGEIRSGWRILIYLSLTLLLFGLEFVVLAFLPQIRNPLSISGIMVGEFASFAAAFGAALLMSGVEGRPSGLYGLPLRSAFGKQFWQGMFVGLCEISFLVGAMKLLGSYSFGGLSFHGAKIIQWALLWLIASILIGLAEEFLFRGYVQYTLAQGIGFWPAAVILSVLFGCMHLTNKGENWVGVVNIIFTGLLWAFTLRRTGTLWLAVGWHTAFDFGESFLYSVPNSGGVFEGHLSNAAIAHGRTWLTGGDVGPEASVFAFVTLAIGAVFVHFWFPAAQKTRS